MHVFRRAFTCYELIVLSLNVLIRCTKSLEFLCNQISGFFFGIVCTVGFSNKKCSKDKNMNTFLSIAFKSSIELTLTFRYDPSENVIYVWLEIEMELGMVAHICNPISPITWEVKTRGSNV